MTILKYLIAALCLLFLVQAAQSGYRLAASCVKRWRKP